MGQMSKSIHALPSVVQCSFLQGGRQELAVFPTPQSIPEDLSKSAYLPIFATKATFFTVA